MSVTVIPYWKVASAVSVASAAVFAFRFYASTTGSRIAMADSIPKNPENWKDATSIYDFTAKDIHGNEISMEQYKGHVCLIVNVASRCGLTATNYKELVELHDKYNDRGLKILAFPCNQFGGQEPGSNEDIICFAKGKNATFDFFDKVDVNGKNTHPLWNYLKNTLGGTMGSFIKWNFTKFIVDKEGKPVERHGPNTDPNSLAANLEKYL